MNNAKFTPGPWVFNACGTENALVHIEEDCTVGGVYRGGNEDSLSHANAHLIAAAPDMYEALQAVRNNLISIGLPRAQWSTELLAKIDSAIDKAEGR